MNKIDIIYANYIEQNNICKELEKEIIYLEEHRYLFNNIKRINIQSTAKYYIETWAIYFDICDEYSSIKAKDVYKKFKLVISFDSLYISEESLKNDLFHILGDYNINNLDDLLNCFILRRYFYDYW